MVGLRLVCTSSHPAGCSHSGHPMRMRPCPCPAHITCSPSSQQRASVRQVPTAAPHSAHCTQEQEDDEHILQCSSVRVDGISMPACPAGCPWSWSLLAAQRIRAELTFQVWLARPCTYSQRPRWPMPSGCTLARMPLHLHRPRIADKTGHPSRSLA